MNIGLETNAPELSRTMRFFADQLPFTQVRTVNRLAFESRDQIRQGVGERFKINKKWVTNGIQIPRGGFATKEKPEAIVELERRRMFLAKFEEGGRIVAPTGRPFAIPAGGQAHPRRLYPVNLGFFPRRGISGGTIEPAAIHATRKGVRQFKGKRRTFMFHPQHHRGVRRQLIVQRTGREEGDWLWLWRLFDVIKVPPLLRFHATAEEVVDANYAAFFEEEFDRVVRTAR
jgi:hypothetical protein